MSVVKSKPITKDTDNPGNQSKLEANTCSRHEARENVRERDTIGFGFTSYWLRKWREILKPIDKRSDAKQRKRKLLSIVLKKFLFYGNMRN